MKNKRMEEFLEDKIDEWHAGASVLPLHAYLRMSWEEYRVWMLSHDLPLAIEARWNR